MVNAKFTITRICSTSVTLPLWIPCKEEEVVLPFQKREGFVCKFLCEQTNPLCGPSFISTSNLVTWKTKMKIIRIGMKFNIILFYA
jgi:hypothetical protein